MTPNPRPPRINIEDDYSNEKASASNSQPGSGNSLDVVIPAHLLQTAANTTVSKRDATDRPNWQPQRQFSVRENPIFRQLSVAVRGPQRPRPIQRSSTLPSIRSSAAPSRVVSRAASAAGSPRIPFQDEEKPNTVKRPEPVNTRARRKSWRLSYTPGDLEQIVLSPRVSRAASPASEYFPNTDRATRDFATRPASNPFTDKYGDYSRHSSYGPNDPFLTQNSSTLSLDQHTVPQAAHVPQNGRGRSGTLETVVNAIVPDALQKKTTDNAATSGGITRHSSMRKTFEQAKLRGAQLQRNKFAMWAFEWGIYLFLLCFIYFVLIGIPLWNGAVWWLYWVVANKFVFAGGFSITLGIALL